MLADLLLLLGLVLLVVAGWQVAPVLGLAAAGVALILLSLALSDGKGFSWRS